MPRRPVSMPAPYLRRLEVDPARLEGREGHPFDLPLARGLDLRFERAVTLIVGDNGSGKSTLLEAIAELAGFPPAGGSRSHVGAVTQDDERLAEAMEDPRGDRVRALRDLRRDERLTPVLRAGWLPKVQDGFFFRAETFFSLARYLDESSLYGPGGPPPLHLRMSHAEGFLDFFADRFERTMRTGRPSLYVFDEPESALSPRRQLEFMAWIRRIERSQRGQVIIATHSPILMAYPGAALWRIRDGRIRPTYLDEVEHFELLVEFARDPHGFVAHELERLEED